MKSYAMIVDKKGLIDREGAALAGYDYHGDEAKWGQLERIAGAFRFMRGSAEFAGVPWAADWRLIFEPDKIWPWRIVDTANHGILKEGAHVVMVFRAPVDGLRYEMEAYGHAFRGMGELAKSGKSLDLMSESARR